MTTGICDQSPGVAGTGAAEARGQDTVRIKTGGMTEEDLLVTETKAAEAAMAPLTVTLTVAGTTGVMAIGAETVITKENLMRDGTITGEMKEGMMTAEEVEMAGQKDVIEMTEDMTVIETVKGGKTIEGMTVEETMIEDIMTERELGIAITGPIDKTLLIFS